MSPEWAEMRVVQPKRPSVCAVRSGADSEGVSDSQELQVEQGNPPN